VAESDISRWTGLLIFGGMFMGFGIKVPIFPFHTWLPDAHTQAPTVGSVILAAVLLKLGTYGFVRVALPILPEAAVEWAPIIGALAVVGIIYGALACLAQTDMKRLIAFSSVSHMGFTMLGIATLTDFGLNAAVMGMVAHGLITGMLFFIAGSVKERYHTLEIRRLGGILLKAPRLGWILGFTAMASLGLPGLAGFWGEFPAILSAYEPGAGLSEVTFRIYMVLAAIGTVFAAGYLLWLYQRTAFGTPTDEFADEEIRDVTVPEWVAWAPMLALILIIGIFPNLVFRVTDDQMTSVAQSIAAAVGG
jgi:NADH-quinone oxidoreductase subunit M